MPIVPTIAQSEAQVAPDDEELTTEINEFWKNMYLSGGLQIGEDVASDTVNDAVEGVSYGPSTVERTSDHESADEVSVFFISPGGTTFLRKQLREEAIALEKKFDLELARLTEKYYPRCPTAEDSSQSRKQLNSHLLES
ncbi:hypothetical protein K7X08_011338 [Anisodus acutangulus]|uniref:Uncharacterized protein n=1 Tax=Anisodus acutangulus TaxID=402998 RepID=A0A9Q1LYJ4_9SOLA|nr:hypothetical protein K7X08_011338 [Anisodus acutangulus]